MLRYLVVSLVIGPFLISTALAGSNPDAKVAIHVSSHVAKRTCDNLPVIGSCEDMAHTYSGGGDVDFFVVFFDLQGHTALSYSVDWPADWGECAFTTCCDFTIGGIVEPGDSVAQSWTDCDSSAISIAGYGWLGGIETPGHISIGPMPGYGIEIVDCEFQVDTSVVAYRAGVYGATGDDPCCSRDDGGEDGDEDGIPPLRIARVIEITDGSTKYMQPIWSPDGMRLAFARKPQFTGLYVRNADGSGPIREITSAAYAGYEPVWTSDSKAIVLRVRTGTVGQSLTSINVETGEVKELVEYAAHPGQPSRNAFGDMIVDIDGEMKVLDAVTGNLESMDSYYSGERPSSFDVRLERDFKNQRVWIVEGDGTKRSEFPYEARLASLSPTRDRVAFMRSDGNLCVSNLDGSALKSFGYGLSWDWTPDGSLLVYISDIRDGEMAMIAADLFVADVETGDVTRLTDTRDVVEVDPRWSPDGTRIAYSTDRTGKICVAVMEEAR